MATIPPEAPEEAVKTDAASHAGGSTSASMQDTMLSSLRLMMANGGKGMGMALAGAGAGLMQSIVPLLAIFATGSPDEALKQGDESTEALRERRAAVTRIAGTKALLELIALASRTNPLTSESTTFDAYRDGKAQAPGIEHVLALAVAAMAMVSRSAARDERIDDQNDATSGDGKDNPPGTASPANLAPVTYVAVAPGEYRAMSGPMTPAQIRRYAMRERSYNQPQLAMMARQSNSFMIMPAGSTGGDAAAHSAQQQRLTAEQYGRMMLSARGSCGCGGGSGASGSGGSCSCGGAGGGGGGGGYAFPPARLDADGSCRSPLKISCDTQTRVRECFKIALCDLIRCVGEEVCDNGQFSSTKPDLKKCLEGFVCTLLTCLPEAICPPPPPATVCITQAVSDCDCNYAVGS